MTVFRLFKKGFIGYYRVLSGFTGFLRGFQKDLTVFRLCKSFILFYLVLPGFTGFYRVFTNSIFVGSQIASPFGSDFQFYRVSLGFTGFYLVLLSFT